MELKIFNRDLELIGILETFTSLRWVRRYHKAGEFELHCPLTSNTIKLLGKDNIIYIGSDEAGFINNRQLRIERDGSEKLIVKGKFLTGYISRRINWDKVIFEGRAETLMHNLVSRNCINTKNPDRKINNLEIGSNNNLPYKISYQNSYGELDVCLESISLSCDYGFKIEFDYIRKKLVFKVYEGVNRTINQSAIAPCLFSRDFENIIKQDYTDSIDNYKNTCLIAGAGEDDLRKKTSIGNYRGLDRYELFVDARDLSDKEKINDVEKIIPWNRYEAMLKQKGNEKLGEYKKVETFDSEINLRSNIKYKEDFDLGDIVTCYDPKWGVTIDTRVTEIEEVYEEKGMEVKVTFGNNVPTLIDKIKAKMR